VYKLFAIWTHPDDVEALERYYVETHAPLAAAIPGLQRLVLTRTSDFLGDGPAPFHRIAELCSDVAEMEARFGVKLHSPAGISVDAELGPLTPAS
jgi:uncharacterized protein (TIGR02118 family)